ncbi:MAG: CBS domain-containing protein [Myxococcales bacterium]|nr:CBS domain-containing protein [Myxococcales bacterium]MCB9534395.1 CBS domain-containing protein [Myxococcales bacterium]
MFAANATIDTLMTRAQHTVAPSDRVSVADAAMRANGIHHLVVEDSGVLVGIVSALDVLRVAPEARGETPVSDVMAADVQTIPMTATIRDTLDRFAAASFSALPVVDATGKVVGIVTTTDLEQLLFSDY